MKMTKTLKKTLWQIAKTSYVLEDRGDLEQHWSDEEDFVDIAVWEIERLMAEAYEAGRRSKP